MFLVPPAADLISLQRGHIVWSHSIAERREIAVESWRERGRDSKILPKRFHELSDGRHLLSVPVHGFCLQRKRQAAVSQHLQARIKARNDPGTCVNQSNGSSATEWQEMSMVKGGICCNRSMVAFVKSVPLV